MISQAWWRYETNDKGRRLILNLHIQPGAKRTEVAGLHGDALKIRLAAQPLEDAANSALLEFLCRIFDVPLRQVILKRGTHSRRKIVEIREPAREAKALYETG
ncbi:MAG TPA: DUF167 domain-containing protein [Nitrosospira sp.]|nr:DUF167 domain-containing protein [Nitrosospira sp.]